MWGGREPAATGGAEGLPEREEAGPPPQGPLTERRQARKNGGRGSRPAGRQRSGPRTRAAYLLCAGAKAQAR